MNRRPAVTVTIPTFNRRPLLEAALASVLAQDVDDMEVFVSDNASTDDTAEYVRSIDDPRLRYERNERNIGLFGNLTRALELGTGRYRVMLPDDDLMLPGNVARKVAFLDANPSAGMVHSGFRFLDDQARPYGEKESWARLTGDQLEPGKAFMRRSIAIGGIVCVSSVMLRSEIVAGERFDEADGPYADLALWLRVASRSDVGFLDEALSGYLVHNQSASSGFDIVSVEQTKDGAAEHHLTVQHANAVLQAHGRVVQRTDLGLDEEFRAELAEVLKTSDRRMRLTILANRTFSPTTLARMKRIARWRPGGTLHRMLALDAPAAAHSAAGDHRE